MNWKRMKTTGAATLLAAVITSPNHKVQAQDPGSAVTLGVGAVLALDVVKAFINEGVKNYFDYYFDYSKADFAVRNAYWAEGIGERYAQKSYQKYRSVVWSLTGVPQYQTEFITKDLRNPDSEPIREMNKLAFADWKQARLQRKWYTLKEDGTLIWEKTHLMRYKFRVLNSNYKHSKYASKQLPGELPAKGYFRLRTTPSRTVNHVDVESYNGSHFVPFSPETKHYTKSISVPVSDFSSEFDLPSNTYIECDSVPPLYRPGTDEDYTVSCFQ